MRILLSLFGLGVVAATSFYLWITRAPSTQLVDAAGVELTAGALVEEGKLFGGSLFEEARRLLAAGQHAEARTRLLEVLETSERDAEACILLSQASRHLKHADEAADYGLKAVELLPASAAAHLAYARALGLQMTTGPPMAAIGTLPRWKEELETVIELDPRDIEARSDLSFFLIFAPSFIGGDVDRALELGAEIQVLDSVRGRQIRALALDKKGETDAAIALCLEVLEQDPAQRALWNTLAGFYAAQERQAEADEAFLAARAGPRDEHYYRSLYMQAEMRIGAERDQEEALAHLEEFIAARPAGDLMPSVARAMWRKGAALEALGRTEDALRAYEGCLRLDEAPAEARADLERLQGE